MIKIYCQSGYISKFTYLNFANLDKINRQESAKMMMKQHYLSYILLVALFNLHTLKIKEQEHYMKLLTSLHWKCTTMAAKAPSIQKKKCCATFKVCHGWQVRF